MRLLYGNKIKDAILTPSSENANYPASNLKDPRLSRHLRFTGDNYESLLMDSGGLLKDIFQATVNLLENSNDLTLWATSGATPTASGLFYDGSEFAKVINDGAAAGFISQNEEVTFTTLTPSENVICRKGNSVGNITNIAIWNITRTVNVFVLTIDFDNYPNSPGTPTTGTLRWYRWIDSQTVELHYTCASLVALTDDIQLKLYASPNATAGEYTYWMRPQLEDLAYDTPYVDGSRAAVSPNQTFKMPGKFIFKIKLRPSFTYNTLISHQFFRWHVDADSYFYLGYRIDTDKIGVVWRDGGAAARLLYSEQFDNGTSYDDINSELILFGATRLDQQTG